MSGLGERLRSIVTLLGLVFRSDPWRAALALTPVIPVASGLSYLAARELLQALPDSDTTAITRGAVIFTVAFAGTVWLGRVVRTTRIRLGELAVTEFNRRRVAAVLAPPGVEHLERAEYLDKLETLRSRVFEVGQVPRMLGWLVDSGGGIAVSVLLLISVDPILALVVAGGIAPALANSGAERRVDAVNAANAARNRRAAHLYDVATNPRDAKEVRVSGVAEELLSRYADEWRTSSRSLLRAELRAGAIRGAGWVLQAAAFSLGVLRLIDGVDAGEVTPGDVFVALGAMALVVGQFGQAAGGLSNLGRVSRLFVDLAAIEAEASAPTDRGGGEVQAPPVLTGGVRLEHVSFRYPGASHDALSGVDLALPAGNVVAIVGENGAGKSTLVKLLFGLYRPTGGRITVDGVDLADIEPDSWRSKTSACFQDFVKLELVARESVGAGDLARIDDVEAVKSAVERAAATDAVSALPDQLDTQLGQRFGGAELSGGQWQKLAIGRAMMRQAPLLLALDEPTGALDPLAEQQIFQTYTNQARALGRSTGAITVLVAHRFSTVRMADLIVVLESGRVREVGDHDTLTARGGLYAELYELQAKHYR